MNPVGEHARLLFEALSAAGVRDVVISPGSRSTPFVLAAATSPKLRCHAVLDERAAGFFALGRAKLTGEPVVLLCTSGSAPAHYLPAVVEAASARVPLLVLSADRPLSLQGCGASQTVDQVKLFGDHARHYAELGLPGTTADELRALRRTVSQAVHRSLHPDPGPVHINARADKPLEPGPAADAAERALEAVVAEVRREPVPVARPPRWAPDEAAVDALAEALRRSERGVIVAGPRHPSDGPLIEGVRWLADRAGLVLCAEATSQLRFTGPSREQAPTLDAFDLVIGARPERFDPDLVLHLGAAPLSAAWDRWVRAHPAVPRVVVSPHGWPDPQSSAAALIVAGPAEVLGALASRLGPGEVRTAWQDRLAALDRAAWDAVRAELREAEGLTEGGAARAVVEALPAGGLLAVGNSLPVRHLEAFCPGALADLRVWSQRGAAGIDGLVAGAAGAADGPTALLLGDLSFLHDLGGLEVARRVEAPFAVVVLDNGGGRIFEQLPVARSTLTAPHLARWTTPHGLPSLEPAARLFGHRHARVESEIALREALAEALRTGGCTVIEAIVPADGARRQADRLAARVAAALDGCDP